MTATSAQDYYFQGQARYARRTHEDNDAALAYTQRAIDLAIGCAWLDDAIAAGEKAIAIDHDLGEAYRVLWEACSPRRFLRKMREAVRRIDQTQPE